MSTKLNPRNIGDILGDTFRIYGRNFWDLVAITAMILGVLGIIEIIAGLGALPLVMTGGEIEALAGWTIAGLMILVVAYIVGGILNFVIHSVLLMDTYAALSEIWRPDMDRLMWLQFVTPLFLSFFFPIFILNIK